MVYLQVGKNKKKGKIYADRAMVCAPVEIKRRQGVQVQYESEGEGGRDESLVNSLEDDLDAPDEPGCQWCQTRGLVVIKTKEHGKVTILSIEMAQMSSVLLSVKAGDTVEKGDEISYFQFGGSDCVMFSKKESTSSSAKADCYLP